MNIIWTDENMTGFKCGRKCLNRYCSGKDGIYLGRKVKCIVREIIIIIVFFVDRDRMMGVKDWVMSIGCGGMRG